MSAGASSSAMFCTLTESARVHQNTRNHFVVGCSLLAAYRNILYLENSELRSRSAMHAAFSRPFFILWQKTVSIFGFRSPSESTASLWQS